MYSCNPTTWGLDVEDVLRAEILESDFPLGVNLQLGYLGGARVELKKGRNRPKSHLIESSGFKS